jgi:hypothetical protein
MAAELRIIVEGEGPDERPTTPPSPAPAPPPPPAVVHQPVPPAQQPQAAMQPPRQPAASERAVQQRPSDVSQEPPQRRSIFNKPARQEVVQQPSQGQPPSKLPPSNVVTFAGPPEEPEKPTQQQPPATVQPPREPPKPPPAVATMPEPDEEPKKQVVQEQPKQDIFGNQPPSRRFTLDQWEQLGADAEQVAQQFRMLPPLEVQQVVQPPAPPEQRPSAATMATNSTAPVQQPARAPATTSAPPQAQQPPRRPMQATSEIQREAKERLERRARNQAVDYEMRRQSDEYRTVQEAREEKKAAPNPEEEASKRVQRQEREKAVEQEMRKQSPEYAKEAELKDVYRENAKAIREMTEAAREEKIALSKMTEEQRIAYLAEKEANRQREAEAVKERAKSIREAEQPPEAEKVLEAKPLHDEEGYRRQAREAMAQRDRSERYRQVRREMDPKFAEEEERREMREQARTVAMGGAAIGGKPGRVLGIASQLMNSPAAMRAIKDFLGQSVKEQPKPQEVSKPEFVKSFSEEREEEKVRQAPSAAFKASDNRIQQQPKQSNPSTAIQTAQTMQRASQTSQAGSTTASAAGATASEGAAGMMAMAAEAVPVVGAIVAAAQLVKQEIAEIGESRRQTMRSGIDVAKASVSGDPNQGFAVLTKSFDSVADAAEKVSPALGLVTPAAKEFVHGVDEMRGTIKQTSERLSQYNGGLAAQSAMQEVTMMQRDISRAERYGPNLQSANAAGFGAEQKLADILDKFAPLALKMSEKSFQALTGLLVIAEKIVDPIVAVAGDTRVQTAASVAMSAAVPQLMIPLNILVALGRDAAANNDNAALQQLNQFLGAINQPVPDTVQVMGPAPGAPIVLP